MNNDRPWQCFIEQQLDTFLSSLGNADWVSLYPTTLDKERLAESGESAALMAMRKVIKPGAMRRFERDFAEYRKEFEKSLWSVYLSKHLKKFLSAVPESDYHPDAAPLTDDKIESWFNLQPKDLYKTLRIWIPQRYVKQFQNRYRAYKHREVRNIKVFDISAKSKAILERYRDEIEANSLDEAIERCFSVNYRTRENDPESTVAKSAIANTIMFGNDVYFDDLMQRLSNNDRQKLALIIERSFKAGWNAAKANRVRKGDPKQQALDEFDLMQKLTAFLPAENVDSGQ
ncbi:hypothetical protein AltI4_44590 (plasmid) [Alteromonas sp. I4]|nr:hypothetical protein AltI4_44590 [Alteromonas sp. I4]